MSGRCPAATWRPIEGHTDGPMSEHLGVVLHVNQSDGNLFSYVSGDHDVSCHFEVYKNGSAEQYLDGATDSWCQRDGNRTYLSMETEGYVNEPLTDGQLNTCAQIMAWAHTEYGIPLQLAERPGDRGLGWHGMGAAAGVDWGHSECPGTIRRGQRGEILRRAQLILNPEADVTPEEVTNMIFSALSAFATGDDHHHWTHATYPELVPGPDRGVYDRLARLERAEAQR